MVLAIGQLVRGYKFKSEHFHRQNFIGFVPFVSHMHLFVIVKSIYIAIQCSSLYQA